ncbi:bifunctional metallophosphatase/5'-nucleotidase [Myxococcaceae bacterium JPH2]|nr:bifunctional metallophosphatase/5'-nucleotidase [Myxococcaceae bacterium JPH2]
MTKTTAPTRNAWTLLLSCALALVLTARPAEGAPPASPPSGTVRLTLLHLNDVYQFQPLANGRGGLARVATLRAQALKQSPNVLTLLAGDTLSPSVESSAEIHGEALKGRQMVDAWNALGIDYAVVGNHEFDFGDDVLRARIHESHFTWLGANVVDATTGQTFAGLKPWDLREVGGVRVGIFGVVLPETQGASKAGPTTQFKPFCEAAQRAVADVRAAGAQVVIALTHLEDTEDRELARCVRVDAIIGGHSHERMEETVEGTPIYKLDEDAMDLGELTLDVDSATGAVKRHAWKATPITARLPEAPAFTQAMKGYAPLLKELAQRVGRSPVPLDARSVENRLGETNLGSFVADAFRAATGADVALCNGGAIRADRVLPAGPLTRRELYSLLPYRNDLVVVDVSGATLRAVLENGVSLSGKPKPPGRFPQVSGLRFAYDLDKPAGERVTRVEVGGKPLDPTATYRLATLSFLTAGNDGYTMLKGLPTRPGTPSGATPWDVLATALRTGRPAPRAKPDGRIQHTGGPAQDAAHTPAPPMK